MRKYVFIFCFIGIMINAQSNHLFIENFAKEILAKKDFNFRTYSQYVHYFNDANGDSELNQHFKSVIFMKTNSIDNKISIPEEIQIKKVDDACAPAKREIDLSTLNCKDYQLYEVLEKQKTISYIILNSKNEIISFFPALNKKKNKYKPWFLDRPVDAF